MSQAGMPIIHGSNWRPDKALQFVNPLSADEARSELLRFTAERHDGYLERVATTWEQLQSQASHNQFNGRTWHLFSHEIVDALGRGLAIRNHQHDLERERLFLAEISCCT